MGTDSISAALAAALDLDGFSDGGEVIVPNYTFVATASAVLERRCTIVFVDISPETFTIDPQAVEAAIGPETRAILPVHLGGHPADIGSLQEIAQRHNLAIIEDCAQAHGAEYQTKKVGSLSDVGAFSFQASKNLTSGEGGMVTTNNKDIHDRVCAFMNVGTRTRWSAMGISETRMELPSLRVPRRNITRPVGTVRGTNRSPQSERNLPLQRFKSN